jgi:hypothetical protein
MALSAGERVTRAYERKYNIDGAQKELVRAHIPRIIQELAATGGATDPGKDRMSMWRQSSVPPSQQG